MAQIPDGIVDVAARSRKRPATCDPVFFDPRSLPRPAIHATDNDGEKTPDAPASVLVQPLKLAEDLRGAFDQLHLVQTAHDDAKHRAQHAGSPAEKAYWRGMLTAIKRQLGDVRRQCFRLQQAGPPAVVFTGDTLRIAGTQSPVRDVQRRQQRIEELRARQSKRRK